ncbi:MAG: MFS transporter [Chloroflexi bacterium]|nr:MFS transporter [Chloroflexota bacterium]
MKETGQASLELNGTAPPAFLKPFDSLRVRAFRIFWIGMWMTWFGLSMQTVARGWYMYKLTGSPLLLGAAAAASGVPMLVISPIVGTLADRIDKRTLLLIGQVGAGLCAIVIAFVIFSGLIQWWHLIAYALVQGSFMAVIFTTRGAYFPELVKPHQLLNAGALTNGEMHVTQIVGPATAGLLIAAIGVDKVYFLVSGMYFVAFLILLRLPKSGITPGARGRSIFKEMGDALRYVKRDVVLVLLLVMAFVAVIFGMPFQTLLPIITEDILKVGPQGLGLLLSMAGIGAVAAVALIAILGDYRHKGMLLLAFAIVWGVGILAFNLSTSWKLSLGLIILVGLGQAGRMTVNMTLLQANVERHMLGRVMSLWSISFGLQTVTALPMGAIAGWIGAPVTMAIAGGALLCYALVALVFQPSLRRLP